MPARKQVPDKNTFERWIAAGLTQAEMRERIETEFGERVTRSAVAQAIVRYGLSTEKERYDREIPWRVRDIHLAAYPARMLRLLGRRRAGKPMTDREEQRLDSWLARLKADRAVVAYDPTHPDGFGYVPRLPGDPRDVPIRKAEVRLPR